MNQSKSHFVLRRVVIMSVVKLADLKSAPSKNPSWLNSIIKGDCVAALEKLPENSVL